VFFLTKVLVSWTRSKNVSRGTNWSPTIEIQTLVARVKHTLFQNMNQIIVSWVNLH